MVAQPDNKRDNFMKNLRKGLVAFLLLATMAISSTPVKAQGPVTTSTDGTSLSEAIRETAKEAEAAVWAAAHEANAKIEEAAKWLYHLFD